jgi:glycosyltransferase involved in cell wall biosynthesis
MTGAPLLSVVVIGRNEGERLRRCLESVQAMDRGDWRLELLYVDSASTDNSVALAGSLGATVLALHPERPTAALARNAGWTHARGEFVLFLDGDTLLHPNFVQSSLAACDDPWIGVVWGHRRELHPERSLYIRVLDLDWVYAPGLTPFCGGDALFRRAALEQSGGFDETLIAGEEPELCRRLLATGWKILHVDRPMTRHDLAVHDFAQYWRRATRAGHAFAEVAERFRETPQPFWSEEVRRNRNRALLLLALPWLAILSAVLLRSVWPPVALLAAMILLALRTAWKARWKSSAPLTLLLYGLHSHFQQIPIFVGQMQFRRNRRRGVRTGLVEYKHRP